MIPVRNAAEPAALPGENNNEFKNCDPVCAESTRHNSAYGFNHRVNVKTVFRSVGTEHRQSR